MLNQNIHDFLGQCSAILGQDFVWDSTKAQSYENNVSAYVRAIPAVVFPRNIDEVKKIVLLANTHRVPLYPISCGQNWGFGSKLPTVDGAGRACGGCCAARIVGCTAMCRVVRSAHCGCGRL